MFDVLGPRKRLLLLKSLQRTQSMKEKSSLISSQLLQKKRQDHTPLTNLETAQHSPQHVSGASACTKTNVFNTEISQPVATLLSEKTSRIVTQPISKDTTQKDPELLIQNISQNQPPVLQPLNKTNSTPQSNILPNEKAVVNTLGLSKIPINHLKKNMILNEMKLTGTPSHCIQYAYEEQLEIETNPSKIYNKLASNYQLQNTINSETVQRSGTFLKPESLPNEKKVLKTETPPKFVSKNKILNPKREHLGTEVIQNVPQIVFKENTHGETHILKADISPCSGKFLNIECAQAAAQLLNRDATQIRPTFLIQNTIINPTHLLATAITHAHPKMFNEVGTHNEVILNIGTSQRSGKFMKEENSQVVTQAINQNEPQFIIPNQLIGSSHLLASKNETNMIQSQNSKLKQLLNEMCSHGDAHSLCAAQPQRGGKIFVESCPQNLPQVEESCQPGGKFSIKEIRENVPQLMTGKAPQSQSQFIIENQLLDPTHTMDSKVPQSPNSNFTQLLNEISACDDGHILNPEPSQSGKSIFFIESGPQNLMQNEEITQSSGKFINDKSLQNVSQASELLASKIIQNPSSKLAQLLNDINTDESAHILSTEPPQSGGKFFIEQGLQNVPQTEEDSQSVKNFVDSESQQNETQIINKEAPKNQPPFIIQNQLLGKSHLLASKISQNPSTKLQDLLNEMCSNDDALLSAESPQNDEKEITDTDRENLSQTKKVSRHRGKFLNENGLQNETQCVHLSPSKITSSPSSKLTELLNEISPHNDTHILNSESHQSEGNFFIESGPQNLQQTDEASQRSGKFLSKQNSQNLSHDGTGGISQNQSKFLIENQILDPTIDSKMPQSPNSKLAQLLNEIDSCDDENMLNSESTQCGTKFFVQSDAQTLPQSEGVCENRSQFFYGQDTHLLTSDITQGHPQLLEDVSSNNDISHILNTETFQSSGKFLNNHIPQNISQNMTGKIAQNQPQFPIENQLSDPTDILDSKLTQSPNSNLTQLLNEISSCNDVHILSSEPSQSGKANFYIECDSQNLARRQVSQNQSQPLILNDIPKPARPLETEIAKNDQPRLKEVSSCNGSDIMNTESLQSSKTFSNEECIQSETKSLDVHSSQSILCNTKLITSTQDVGSKVSQDNIRILTTQTSQSNTEFLSEAFLQNTASLSKGLTGHRPPGLMKKKLQSRIQILSTKIIQGPTQTSNESGSLQTLKRDAEILKEKISEQNSHNLEHQHSIKKQKVVDNLNMEDKHTRPLILNKEEPHSDTMVTDESDSQIDPKIVLQSLLEDKSYTINDESFSDPLDLENSQHNPQFLSKEELHPDNKISNENDSQIDPKILIQNIVEQFMMEKEKCSARLNTEDLQMNPKLLQENDSHPEQKNDEKDQGKTEGSNKNDSQIDPSLLLRKILEGKSYTIEKEKCLDHLKTENLQHYSNLINEGKPHSETKLTNKNDSQINPKILLPNILERKSHTIEEEKCSDQLNTEDMSRYPKSSNESNPRRDTKFSNENDLQIDPEVLLRNILECTSPMLRKEKCLERLNTEDSQRHRKLLQEGAPHSVLKVANENDSQINSNFLLKNILEGRSNPTGKKCSGHLNRGDLQRSPKLLNEGSLNPDKKVLNKKDLQIFPKSVIQNIQKEKLYINKHIELGSKDLKQEQCLSKDNSCNDAQLKTTAFLENAQSEVQNTKQQLTHLLSEESSKNKTHVSIKGASHNSVQNLKEANPANDSKMPNIDNIQHKKQILKEKDLQSTPQREELCRELLKRKDYLQNDKPCLNKEASRSYSQFLNKETSHQDTHILNTETSQSDQQSLSNGPSQKFKPPLEIEGPQRERNFFKYEDSDNEFRLLNTKTLRRGPQFLNHDNSQNAQYLLDNEPLASAAQFISDENSQNARHLLDTKVPESDLQYTSKKKPSDNVSFKTEIAQIDSKVISKKHSQRGAKSLKRDNSRYNSPCFDDDYSEHYTEYLPSDEISASVADPSILKPVAGE